jgi:hypothetical protein
MYVLREVKQRQAKRVYQADKIVRKSGDGI